MLETLAREADLAARRRTWPASTWPTARAAASPPPATTRPRTGPAIVLSRGEGVGGRVLTTGRAVRHQRVPDRDRVPRTRRCGAIQTAVGVPMVWDGELKGALSVGFTEHAPRHRRRTCARSRRSPSSPSSPAATPRPTRRPASRPPPTRSPGCSTTARCTCARARRSRAPAASGTPLVLPAARPRRLQGRQRRARPPGRRRAAARRRRRAARRAARPRRDRPLRRRRVRGAAPRRRRAPAAASSPTGSPPPRRCRARSASPSGASRCPPTSCCTAPTARCCWPSARARSAWRSPAPSLEQELELVEARAGSPEAIMREFWEMVAASESSRDDAAALPAFLRRTIGAEEVALFELAATPRSCAPPSRTTPTAERARVRASTACRATSALRERLALGAISRPTLDGILAAIGVEDLPEARDAPAGAYAVVPLLWAGRPHGLIAVRTRRELSTERLRLAELLSRQTMAVLTARSPRDGSPGRRPGARGRHRGARQLHARALRAGRLARHRRRPPARARPRRARRRPPRRAAARRRQARDPRRDPPQARPADRRRVAGDGRAPRDRRADPAPHPAARPPRPDRAPRARALGRRAATPTASPAPRSRSPRGSSSPATPTTR